MLNVRKLIPGSRNIIKTLVTISRITLRCFIKNLRLLTVHIFHNFVRLFVLFCLYVFWTYYWDFVFGGGGVMFFLCNTSTINLKLLFMAAYPIIYPISRHIGHFVHISDRLDSVMVFCYSLVSSKCHWFLLIIRQQLD